MTGAPRAGTERPHAGDAVPDGEDMPLVLVVEDRWPVLRDAVAAGGMRTVEARREPEVLARAVADKPDLILLDLDLPDLDGLEVTRRLRAWTAGPILVLSARRVESDKIRLLDMGANDYMTKPVGTGELLARMRVWLRNTIRSARARDAGIVEVGELRLDAARRLVSVAGREVHLTPIEYSLFATLMQSAGCLLTHRQLLRAAWGPSHDGDTHYVRIYMRQLRRKLEADATKPRYLITEPGVGYRLRVDTPTTDPDVPRLAAG